MCLCASCNQGGFFEAVRLKLRATYDYGAAFQSLTDQHQALIFSGQVETDKIAEAATVIRDTYADFLSAGISGDLQERKDSLTENLKKSRNDTGTMAYVAMMAKLNGQDAMRALQLQTELDAVTEQSLKQRLTDNYPKADDLIVIVSSSDANVLPDACVITRPEQAIDC